MEIPIASMPAWLPVVIVVAFPLYFVLLWSGVCLLISAIGGWGRLAKKYPGSPAPKGTRFSWQSGRFGLAKYNNVLMIHVSPEGLHLAVARIFRFRHPPLFIPWNEIRNASVRRVFRTEYVEFEVGSPKLATLRLPREIFENARSWLEDALRHGMG